MTEVDLWNPTTLAMNSHRASSVAEAKSPHGSVLEIKYDGHRILAHVSEDAGVQLYARSGKSKAGKLPHVEDALRYLPPGTWLDGEAVQFNEDGTQHWGGAQSVLGSHATRRMQREQVKYVIFDVLAFAGEDVRPRPFRERRELLEKLFLALSDAGVNHIILSMQLAPTDENHEMIIGMGFEGTMVKHLDAPYRSGKRVKTSLKLKAVDTEDVIITGFKAPKPGWIANAKLIGSIEFITDEGVTGYCSGMTVPERTYITQRQAELIGTVIEVSYMTKLPSGSLRHANFVRFRPDKEKP